MVNGYKNDKIKTMKKLSDVSGFNQIQLINVNEIISSELELVSLREKSFMEETLCFAHYNKQIVNFSFLIID